MLKDILAQAVFTSAVDRLTKAAKKNGLDIEDVDQVFSAVRAKHFPQLKLPLAPK